MSHCNDKFKHIFIHIPKTAGSSMERQPFVGGLGHARLETLVNNQNRDYFKWCFVRNPYDRLVSFHAASQQHGKLLRNRIPSDFTTFVKEIHKHQTIWHVRRQISFITIKNEIAVDFIGSFENLQRDWTEVCDRIGVKRRELPKLNASKHTCWSAMYTEETLNITTEFYLEDFKRLNYPTITAEELTQCKEVV